jgi:predicted dehydrogenase
MSDTIKAVMVGCGSIAGAWLRPAQNIPNLEIVGLVDLAEEMARQKAVKFNLPEARIGSDLGAMLDVTRPDVVFDCTVPAAHLGVTLLALSKGCHVLGEKPMADSMANARRMVAAAQEAGKLYAVIQNRRYMPEIRRMQKLAASGTLGPLTNLDSDFYLGPHFGGFRDQMQHVLLLDMAIHTFDMARYITGTDPVSVYCHEWNPTGSWYAHGASAVAIFQMTDGLVYTYRGSWCAEGLPTTWEGEWRLVGQRGTAKWDGGTNVTAQVVAKTEAFFSEHAAVEPPTDIDPNKTDRHGALIREFVQCVRDGTTPNTICTDNIKSLAMVFGAIESAETQKPVTIAL